MLLQQIKKTIRRHQLLDRNDKVLAACSGGPDSVALLQLLVDLDWNLSLTAAHFNHQLRPTADEDEQFTRDLAERLSLPFESRREDIRNYARNHGMNLEEAARIRRYAFLEEAAAGSGAARIALGHTLSDQAETVLMHLFRGAGLRGLGGMPPQRGKIIRPLLDIPREQILKYLAEKGMDYRVDETNYDIRFLRSRVRHRILPILEKQIHPNIQEQMGRLADIIRTDDTYLQQKAREVLQSVQQNFRGRPALIKAQLDDLPLALRRRTVREFLRSLRGDTAGLTFDDIERCLDLKKEQVFPLEKGLKLKNIRGFITAESKSAPLNYDLNWDGQSPLIIPETGQKLTLATCPNPGTARLEFNDKKNVWLDVQKISLPLRVRNRRRGDRYRPLRAPGRKTLKEMFRSRDIAPDDRDRFPVILSQGEIIWVAGLPAAHDFRVTDKTAVVMKIEVERD